MRQLFLPLGLILAAFFALTLPQAGVVIADHSGIKLTIIIIFLISGYQTGTAGIALNRGLLHIFLSAAAVSLLLAPLLGLAIGTLLALPPSLLIGLLIICAVPPTLSSGIVITGVSRGNTVLALMLTISLNLTGILTLPTILHFCLKASGPVTIDQWALFSKMLLLVLLPFVIGKCLRNMVKKKMGLAELELCQFQLCYPGGLHIAGGFQAGIFPHQCNAIPYDSILCLPGSFPSPRYQ
ncbi:MAG: hypothetical protein D3903_20740 [Candidatus Electrothrix sp. GM3_4]|nr:hypothetical protein [Candidatus Electrothrix sp. GM3_4]